MPKHQMISLHKSLPKAKKDLRQIDGIQNLLFSQPNKQNFISQEELDDLLQKDFELKKLETYDYRSASTQEI